MVFCVIAAWYAVGVSGFVFWYNRNHDIMVANLLSLIFIGWMGPLTWVVGYIVHGKPRVLIKRRRRGE